MRDTLRGYILGMSISITYHRVCLVCQQHVLITLLPWIQCKNDALVYIHFGAMNHAAGRLTYALIYLNTRLTGWSVAPKIGNACTHWLPLCFLQHARIACRAL